LQRKRERAIELLHQGLTQAEVAHILDVDARSVRRWKRADRAGARPPCKRFVRVGDRRN